MAATRRTFLHAGAALTLTAAAYGRVLGANETIGLGVIGCGGRGRSLLIEALKLNTHCIALADVARFRTDHVAKVVVAADQERPDCFLDHRKLLDMKGVDCVILAVPDHHHRDMLIATVQAEKDVYVEKPLTRTLDEGKEMIEAVRRAERVVQVGNQRHSGSHWKRCRDIIQSNDFGDLVWAKVWDCRNWIRKDPFAPPRTFTKDDAKSIDWDAFLGRAPQREFNAMRYWSWRWFWDYAGGLMTDIGAHQLDIVQWLGGVDAPKSVVANGGNYHFKHWETPDIIHGVWDYGKFTATFAVQFVNGADGVGAAFYGTRMTLVADANKNVCVYDTIDPIKPEMKPVDQWPVESSTKETHAHIKNWLDCCASRRDPNSPIELGHRVITSAHLANLSYRTGKKIYWDAEREQVIGG